MRVVVDDQKAQAIEVDADHKVSGAANASASGPADAKLDNRR